MSTLKGILFLQLMKQIKLKMEKSKNTIPPLKYFLLSMYIAVAKPQRTFRIAVVHINCFVKSRASQMYAYEKTIAMTSTKAKPMMVLEDKPKSFPPPYIPPLKSIV